MRNYIKLYWTMFGLQTRKERWFELYGFEIGLVPFSLYSRGMVKRGELVGIVQHSSFPNEVHPGTSELARAYRIDWMTTRHDLRQAIPPAYSRYIWQYLIKEWLRSNDVKTRTNHPSTGAG